MGLHGPGWLDGLGMPPRASVALSTPRSRGTNGTRPGPKHECWVRAGSLCDTEPRARGKTRGQKRKMPMGKKNDTCMLTRTAVVYNVTKS